MKRTAKKIPYFLLYNYPEKLEAYNETKKRNEKLDPEDRFPLNAYRSPSPMNELCDYIESWEKERFVWARPELHTKVLISDPSVALPDVKTRRLIRNEVSILARELSNIIARNAGRDHKDYRGQMDAAYEQGLRRMEAIVPDHTILANTVIDITYSNINGHQSIAWQLFGDVIIENLKKNTPWARTTRIVEVPYQTNNSYEYLGKYYEMLEG